MAPMHFHGGSLGEEFAPPADATLSRWSYLDTTMPTGIPAPQALYQFDGTANALTDRSANNFDLTASVAPAIYQNYPHETGDLVGLAVGILELQNTDADDLHTTGAVTIEAIVALHAVDDVSDQVICQVGGDSEVEAENIAYMLYMPVDTNNLAVLSEHGAALDDTLIFDAILPVGAITHVISTRNADGVTWNLFINGQLLDTGVVANVPTGGTSDIDLNVSVGDNGTENWHGMLFSLRITFAELNAVQALESYNNVYS